MIVSKGSGESMLKPSRLPLRGTSGQVKHSVGFQEKQAAASFHRNQIRLPWFLDTIKV
jgi:hypothetical protein